MVLETVAIETFALAATDRISSNARCFRLRLGVFGIHALGILKEGVYIIPHRKIGIDGTFDT
jgi:hypothetical protein